MLSYSYYFTDGYAIINAIVRSSQDVNGTKASFTCVAEVVGVKGNVNFMWRWNGAKIDPGPGSRIRIKRLGLAEDYSRINSTLTYAKIRTEDDGNEPNGCLVWPSCILVGDYQLYQYDSGGSMEIL